MILVFAMSWTSKDTTIKMCFECLVFIYIYETSTNRCTLIESHNICVLNFVFLEAKSRKRRMLVV